jgi:hypothetical protein
MSAELDKFKFVISKIENNTFYVTEFDNSTLAKNTTDVYDSYGAANYIVVVVLVYGFSIIFFIASQVRSSKKVSDEVDEVNGEKILRSMQTEIFTREVLGKSIVSYFILTYKKNYLMKFI